MNTILLLLKRLPRLCVVLVAAVVITFSMVHLVPGDPARSIAGPQADERAVQVAREQFGLNRPLGDQLKDYVAGLLRGDLGTSFKSREPVAEIIRQNIGATLELTVATMLVVVLLGTTAGLLMGLATQSGRRRVDSLLSAVSGALVAFPSYLTATFLVFFFAVTWSVFPVAGAIGLESLVLPAFALGLGPAMVVARVIRVRTAEVMEQPYIRTARSKRMSETRLYVRHVLPNTLPAALAICGVLFTGLLGGAVVIETVFARPGLGSTLVSSVTAGDYPVVQGVTIVFSCAIVLVNLAVDLIVPMVDPQTRGD
ncbi:ABC transporter permease [Streptomyces sp. NPDC055607]